MWLRRLLGFMLHNLGEPREANSAFLKNLVETTSDPGIGHYGWTVAFLAERMGETFEQGGRRLDSPGRL